VPPVPGCNESGLWVKDLRELQESTDLKRNDVLDNLSLSVLPGTLEVFEDGMAANAGWINQGDFASTYATKTTHLLVTGLKNYCEIL
jgi:hypothetical protein